MPNNNLLPHLPNRACHYGVHTVVAEDMRTARDGFPVCKDCRIRYNNHDGFAPGCCSDDTCPNNIELSKPDGYTNRYPLGR